MSIFYKCTKFYNPFIITIINLFDYQIFKNMRKLSYKFVKCASLEKVW